MNIRNMHVAATVNVVLLRHSDSSWQWEAHIAISVEKEAGNGGLSFVALFVGSVSRCCGAKRASLCW